MSDHETLEEAEERLVSYEKNGHTEFATHSFMDIMVDSLKADGNSDALFEEWAIRRARIIHDAQPLLFAKFMARLRRFRFVDARAYEQTVVKTHFEPLEKPHIVSVTLSDVEPEYVEWLWDPYIPLGKITILEGDPGLGKTFLMLTVASAVTRGYCLPDQNGKVTPPHGKEADVLYITAEDGIADTIRPRAGDANVNLSRLHCVTGWTAGDGLLAFSFEQLPLLADEIDKRQAKLVIIDPIQAFLGAHVDMFRANEVRPVLMELGNIALEKKCAVIFIRHWTKAPGGKAKYRGQGSIDFTATARSVLVIGESPDDDRKRILAQSKNNLKPMGCSIVFALTDGGLEWCGTSEIDADTLASMQPDKRKHQMNNAADWLKGYLRAGPQPASQILEDAKNLNIAEKTLRRAKEQLQILAAQESGQWFWRLPQFSPWDKSENGVPV